MSDCRAIGGYLPDGRTPIRCMLTGPHDDHVAHLRWPNRPSTSADPAESLDRSRAGTTETAESSAEQVAAKLPGLVTAAQVQAAREVVDRIAVEVAERNERGRSSMPIMLDDVIDLLIWAKFGLLP